MDEFNLTNEEREKFIRLCQAAHAAALAGKPDEAHLYFRYAARIHPYSTTVWLGLSKVVKNPQDQRVALENVLAIDPDHAEAKKLLDALQVS